MKGTRSLVTGACGFIGSHVVEELAGAGHEVIATDILSAWETTDAKRKTCVEAVRSAGVKFMPSDVTKPGTLKSLPWDVDYVFHVASIFSYGAPWKKLREVNLLGTMNLVETAMEKGKGRLKRFILWGAGGVYGLPERQEIPFREDVTIPDPGNDYLRSKWQQEFYVMNCGKKLGLPYTILRPTTVYGPRGWYGGGQMLTGLASSRLLAVPKNFTGRIPFIHVRDVARAGLHLAMHDGAAMEVFNVNDDSTMTTVEFFRFIADMRGRRLILLPPMSHMAIRRIIKTLGAVESFLMRDILGIGPFLETDSVDYLNGDFVYSNEKLKKTGFKFLYPDPRQGVEETIQWFIKNGWMK